MSVAKRVAEEMGCEMGEQVAYLRRRASSTIYHYSRSDTLFDSKIIRRTVLY